MNYKNNLFCWVIITFGFFYFPSLWGQTRAASSVSSSVSCKDIFVIKKSASLITDVVKDDFAVLEQSARIRDVIESDPPPIKLTKKMSEFRKQYLPFLKIDSLRESLILSMEAEMRLKSLDVKKNLEGAVYDLVIIGAGVHGVLAAQAALAKNPSLRILMVEGSDTAAANFRYALDVFSINSSNRASGPGRLALPGQGNINELPGLPIQVSDLSPVKYPAAGDLGAAVVSGLYALVKNYKLDVAFTSELTATRVTTGEQKYELTVVGDKTNTQRVNTNTMIVATGLGKPVFPKTVTEDLKKYKELTSVSSVNRLPKVLSFEDAVRIVASSNNPKELFAGKKIGIVGVGDSANVFIEFLLGYAPRSGYGISSAQVRDPQRIVWLGQTLKDCKEFIDSARSRYAQIGTGFRSSDANGNPIIQPIGDRVVNLVPTSSDKVAVATDGPSKVEELDHVIFATGYKGNLAEVLQGLFPSSKVSDAAKKDDRVFLEENFEFVEGKTSTSGGKVSRIAKKAIGHEVYVAGPSAGKLPTERELLGIIQNFVSIFNNSPRTVSIAKKVAEMITKRIAELKGSLSASAARQQQEPILSLLFEAETSGDKRQISISGLETSRSLGPYASQYLQNVIRAALQQAPSKSAVTADSRLLLELQLTAEGELMMSSFNPLLNFEGFAKALAVTRDFYTQVYNTLSYNPGKSFYIEIGQTSQGLSLETLKSYFANSSSQTGAGAALNLENPTIPLRSIEEFQ